MEEQTQQNKDGNYGDGPPEEELKENDSSVDSDSLESSSTTDETAAGPGTPPPSDESIITDTTHGADIKKKNPVLRGVSKITRVNIYLLLFFLLLLLAGIVTYVSFQRNKAEEEKKEALLTEPLSQETLDQLKQSDVRIGDPKQILSIESNAIFSGKVLIRDSLEVAGQLKIGGPLNLPGITVSGASAFDQVTIKNLDISGNTNIQGQLSVQQGVTVGGNLSVAGNLSASQLTLEGLQLSGDLQLNRHIDAGGGTPGKSNGSALGSGGTTSVSGTDTAGTVNIRTGGGSGSGCYVTLRFAHKFNAAPHVVITPVGSAAGALNYYINRSASEFSICTTNGAGGGKSFAFDYIVID
ncbi:hypothetical protein KY385_04135 [Candidatus Parcubacteria bacterium]|nr:hypothetical protein [Candidatus Parcubacteria bacterium]